MFAKIISVLTIGGSYLSKAVSILTFVKPIVIGIKAICKDNKINIVDKVVRILTILPALITGVKKEIKK